MAAIIIFMNPGIYRKDLSAALPSVSYGAAIVERAVCPVLFLGNGPAVFNICVGFYNDYWCSFINDSGAA